MANSQTKMTKNDDTTEIPTIHWADHAATELIEKDPHQSRFVCASGISPSGIIHIGNFREAITVAFVVRALRDRGKEVRAIHSWDDFDALRKIPPYLPNQELLQANLRKPLAKVPDPYGGAGSYAAHFEDRFEKSLKETEIDAECIRQNVPYQAAYYAQGIKDAIANEKTIIEILNRSRTEPLPANWTCLSIFCKQCDRDITELLQFTPPATVKYRCKPCKKEFEVSVDEPNSGVKLLWRVDWPMRWTKEKVDFEPGGKDHSSQGGSFDTGAEIIRAVWKREPPFYVQYDFVVAKGLGAKLSSSSGVMITPDEALAIYEPAVLRWIFASRKPNLDFSIAFDLDVLKTYDDFDRTTRIALKQEQAEERKHNYERRIYDLSRTSHYPKSSEAPKSFGQFPFRHLCNILQIHQGDVSKAKNFFSSVITSQADEVRFDLRAVRAWKWITEFAPPDFRFSLRTAENPSPKAKFVPAVTDLVKLLEEIGDTSITEEDLAGRIYTIMKTHQLEPKAFFQDVYSVLIAKTNGPKLASFLIALGLKNAAERITKAI